MIEIYQQVYTKWGLWWGCFFSERIDSCWATAAQHPAGRSLSGTSVLISISIRIKDRRYTCTAWDVHYRNGSVSWSKPWVRGECNKQCPLEQPSMRERLSPTSYGKSYGRYNKLDFVTCFSSYADLCIFQINHVFIALYNITIHLNFKSSFRFIWPIALDFEHISMNY